MPAGCCKCFCMWCVNDHMCAVAVDSLIIWIHRMLPCRYCKPTPPLSLCDTPSLHATYLWGGEFGSSQEAQGKVLDCTLGPQPHPQLAWSSITCLILKLILFYSFCPQPHPQ
eukprot:1161859-Pelagomonas_calceolata.AAC.5